MLQKKKVFYTTCFSSGNLKIKINKTQDDGDKMVTSTLQRVAYKQIAKLTLKLSDENLIKAVEIGEKYLIKDKSVKRNAESIKKALKEHSPTVRLVRGTLERLSPKCREKLIENFFINAGVLGSQKQKKLEKKLGFGLPWFFVMSPTAQCNLSCTGCYAHEYSKHKGLPFEEVDRILKEAKSLGIYFITISGGEPFAWPHLLKMFKKHNDMYFQVYTNSTLITKDVAKELAQLGNVAPAISVEGFEKETDARRGPGVYKKIMQAMDNLKEAGVMFGFSATPTRLNSEIVATDKFIDGMIKRGCSFGWYFQYTPIGKKPDVSLMATPKQRVQLRKRVLYIRDKKPIFIGDFWNDGPFVGGCMAGARPGGYFHINCNGDVEPCAFLQYHVDNIKGKKLVDVIQSPFFKAIQREAPYCQSKNLLTPCALIDNPEVLRRLVKKYGAEPSHNSSMDAIEKKEVVEHLDKYSKELHALTDPIWEKELKKKHKHWKEIRKWEDK